MWKDKRKEGREAGSLKGRRGREGKEARRVGRKQQSQRDIYTGFTQEPSGRKGNQYLLKVHFTPLVCVWGISVYTLQPQTKGPGQLSSLWSWGLRRRGKRGA